MRPKSNLYILAILLLVGTWLVIDFDCQERLLISRGYYLYASEKWSASERGFLKIVLEDAYKKVERILGQPGLQNQPGLVTPVEGATSSCRISISDISVGGFKLIDTVDRRINLSRLAIDRGRLRGVVFHELAHHHVQPYSNIYYQFDDGLVRFNIFGEAVAETVRLIASESTSLEPFWEYDQFQVTPECNKPQLCFRGDVEQYMPLYGIRERMAATAMARWERRYPGFLKKLHQGIYRRKFVTPRFQEDILPIAESITPGFSRYITSQFVFKPYPKKGYNLFVIGDDDEIFCSLSYTDSRYNEQSMSGSKVSLSIDDGKSITKEHVTLGKSGIIRYYMPRSTGSYTVTARWDVLGQQANKTTDSFTFNKDAILR